MAYNGSIDLISGIRTKNNGEFPLVHAKDVYVDDDTRLNEKLEELAESGGAGLIAATFSESTANDAGSYVIYDGALYVLPNGHAANATWANTTKTQVVLSDEVSGINGALAGLGLSVVNGEICVTYEEGNA